MEDLRPFHYWTLWMSKRHTVTLHHIITFYNNMFDHMDGVMRVLAEKMTQWREDLYIAETVVHQKLSKYYAEVTPMTGLHLISENIFDSIREWRLFRKWDKAIDSIPEDEPYILPNTRRPVWCMWRTNTVLNIDECLSLNPKMSRLATSAPLHRLPNLVNRLLIHMICRTMMKIT